MGAELEQANINNHLPSLSSTDKKPSSSINPKLVILGSLAAFLGVGTIAGISYKAGKSANASDVAARPDGTGGGTPPVTDPKPGKSEESVSNSEKKLEGNLDGKTNGDQSHPCKTKTTRVG